MFTTRIKPVPTSVCVIFDKVERAALSSSSGLFTEWQTKSFYEAMRRGGLDPSKVTIKPIGEMGDEARRSFLKKFNLIIPLDNKTLKFTTGKGSIEKWHLSPLDSIIDGPKKVLPTYHPKRVMVEPKLKVYQELTFRRAAEESQTTEFTRLEERFLLNPDFDETLETLEKLKEFPVLGVDIETGRGQINTVGFSWSANDAIAIHTLPKRLSDEKFYTLWCKIAEILENPKIGKVLQNNIYESQVFAHYGILLSGVVWDTMWAQKFLWPEFKMGLDEVGRIYTRRPYWKDDGKVSIEGEANRKSWDFVNNWERHYKYNCRDTTGTFEAMENQMRDFSYRRNIKVFQDRCLSLIKPVQEMCHRGLIVDTTRLELMKQETTNRMREIEGSLSQELNLRSPKQKMEFLKSKGFTMPRVRVGGKFQESSNELALRKLRRKYPEDPDLPLMLEYLKLNKKFSSYLNFNYDKDGVMRYSLKGVGTETGRMAGGTDCFGQGMNPQTIPKDVKKIFRAPEGRVFIEIDLSQAESRFVAYDSNDISLIRMLEDPTKDIHRYVAAEIFQKPEEEITHSERQLGKKSGHGANYDMGVNTFIDQCLKDGIILGQKEAKNVLESYHRLFPGIRRWHREIKNRVLQQRRLTNPFGRTRYFYGRIDSNTSREAFAYRPQSTIPDITNELLIQLCRQRDQNRMSFFVHLQVHDSILLSAYPQDVKRIVEFAYDLNMWHPQIDLPGGQLRIPTEAESGIYLGELEEVRV